MTATGIAACIRYADGTPPTVSDSAANSAGAAMLHDALNRLARRFGSPPPLNLWVRTAPPGADHFGWRIDIMPRLTYLAGLELGAGVHLNIVPPEQVAAELRDA